MDNKKHTLVYGGAFDPPTVAHEAIIRDLVKLAEASGDVRILIYVTDNDEKKYSAPVANRVDMVKTMLRTMRIYAGTITLSPEGMDIDVLPQKNRLFKQLGIDHLLDGSATVCLGMDEWDDLCMGARWYASYTGLFITHWEHPAELAERVRFRIYSRDRQKQPEYTPTTLGVDYVPIPIPAASSTEVRKALVFSPVAAPAEIPPSVREYIAYHRLYGQERMSDHAAEEREFLSGYSAKDFPKPSVTATVVIHNDRQVLLVRRKAPPFKGYWCFPGGFSEPFEDIEEVGLRELREETGIESSLQVRHLGVFTPDDPRVSRERGEWAYDVALGIDVGSGVTPVAKAGDDAADVKWVDFDDMDRVDLAFHHRKIWNVFNSNRDGITVNPVPRTIPV